MVTLTEDEEFELLSLKRKRAAKMGGAPTPAPKPQTDPMDVISGKVAPQDSTLARPGSLQPIPKLPKGFQYANDPLAPGGQGMRPIPEYQAQQEEPGNPVSRFIEKQNVRLGLLNPIAEPLQDYAAAMARNPLKTLDESAGVAAKGVEMISPMTSFSEGYQGVDQAGRAIMRGDFGKAGTEALRGVTGYAGTALDLSPAGLVNKGAKFSTKRALTEFDDAMRTPAVTAPTPVGASDAGGGFNWNPFKGSATPEEKAFDIILKRMDRDGLTVDDLVKAHARLKNQGGNFVETLGELGGANMRGLAQALGSVPGEAQAAIVSTIQNNAEKLPARMTRAASSATGQKAANAVDSRNALKDRIKAESGPAYDAFFASPVDGGVFQSEIFPILATSEGRGAAQDALGAIRGKEARLTARLASAKDSGARASAKRELDYVVQARVSLEQFLADPLRAQTAPTPYALDRIKRAFDNQIEAAGQGSEKARDLRETKRSWAESVTNATGGAYAEALGIWEGGKRVDTAFDMGLAALTKPTWRLQEEVAEGINGRQMSGGEIEAFAMGVARHIEDLIESNDQRALTMLSKTKALKNLETAIGDKRKANRFAQAIDRLMRNREFGRRIDANSQTAQRQAAIRDATEGEEDTVTRILDSVADSGAPPTIPGLIGSVAVKPLAKIAGEAYRRVRSPGIYNPEINSALAPRMGTPLTPQPFNELVEGLRARQAKRTPAGNALTSGAPANAFADPPTNALTTPPSTNAFDTPPDTMGYGATKQFVGPQAREAAARYFSADPARVDLPLSVIARDLNVNMRSADALRTEARGGSRPRSRPRQNAFADMTGNALTNPAVQGGVGGAGGGIFAGDANGDGRVSMDERFQSAGLGAVGTIMAGGLMRNALTGAGDMAANGVRGAVRRAPVEVTDDLIMEAAQKLGPDQFEIWKAATMGRNADGLPLTNDEIVDLINVERADATLTRENVRVQLSKIRAKGFDVPDAPNGALSDNTQKLIELSAQGVRPKDIAERLGMTKNTVGALKTRHKADIEARRAELQQAAPQASAAADLSQYSEGTRQAIELAAMDYPVSRIAQTLGFEPQNVERILAQLKPAIDARKAELDAIKGMKPEAMGFGGGGKRKADSIVAKMQKSGDMAVNPSGDELRAMMRQQGNAMGGDARSRGRSLRLLLNSETGDMYAWPAEEVWHFDVARDLNLNAPTTFRATLDPGERLENVSWKDWSDKDVGSTLDKKFRQGDAAGREPADTYMDLTTEEIAADMKLRGMTGPARNMGDYPYRRKRAMEGVERDPETGNVSWKTRSGKAAKLDPQGMGGADLGLDGFNAKMSRAPDGSAAESRETFEKAFSVMEREAIRRNEPLYVITPTRNKVPPEKQALRGGDETRGRERLYLGLLQRLGPPRGYVAAVQKTDGSVEVPPRILLLRADYFNDLVAQGRMSPDDFDIFPPKRGMTPEPEWRRKIGLFGAPAAVGAGAAAAPFMGGEADAQSRPSMPLSAAARAAVEEQMPARVIADNRAAAAANRIGMQRDAGRYARLQEVIRSVPQAPPVRYARSVDPDADYDYSREWDPTYAGYRGRTADGMGGRK